MAEASSSASSASAPIDTLGTPTGKRARSEKGFFLAIRKQPPEYVFPNEKFELEFAIDGSDATSASPPTDIEVIPSLVNVSPESLVSECSMEILSACRISPSRKTGTVKCCIRSPRISRRHGCSMQIRLWVSEDRGIAPCNTRPICLVNTKLHVKMSSEWDDMPFTWFKDEGGRDRCMEGDVTLWNEHNDTVKENLQLDLTLCYQGENNVMVSSQDVLRRIGSDQLFQIDENTGSGKIRFRIEDVSKNHQKQNFVVKVSPAKHAVRDIAPAYTPPVLVRSKRSRPSKQKQSSSRPAQLEQPSADLNLPSPSESGRRSSYSDAGMLEGADMGKLRHAVQKVARWAEDVVHSLYHMQWHVIGYARCPNGGLDYNRPYHSNIQDPNPVIKRVLGSYFESVQKEIGYIQGALEPNTGVVAPASVPVRASPYNMAPTPQPGIPAVGPTRTSPYARGIPQQRFPQPPDYQHFPPHQPYHHQQPVPQPQPQQLTPLQHDPAFAPYYYVPQHSHAAKHSPRDTSPVDDRKVASLVDVESKVEYVLAKKFKSVRTQEPLGLPAFSAEYELVGFYDLDSSSGLGSHFVSIEQHDFSAGEKLDARKIVENAVTNKSEEVHRRRDYDSIRSLIEQCRVYIFRLESSTNL